MLRVGAVGLEIVKDFFGPWCQVGHVRRSFSVGERDVWVCCLEAADVESPLARKVAVRWLKVRGVRIFYVSVGLNTSLVRFGHPGHQLLVEELGCYFIDAGRQSMNAFGGAGQVSAGGPVGWEDGSVGKE